MKYLLTLAVVLCGFGVSRAQQAETVSSLGLKGGIMTYNGELNDQFFPATRELRDLRDNLSYISWGIDFERYFGNGWGIGLEYINGEFSATDRRTDFDGNFEFDAPNFERALNVKTQLNDLILYGKWSANDGKFLSENAFLSPYIKLGVGATRFKTFGDLRTNGAFYEYGDDGNVFIRTGDNMLAPTELDGIYETELSELRTNGYAYNNYAFVAMGGVGLNFRFNDHFSLQLESMFRISDSDNLDDVGGPFQPNADDALTRFASNPNDFNGTRGESGNDRYTYHNLTARFYFGDRSKMFRAPVVIVGEIPLQDTLATENKLFSFDTPEPLAAPDIDPIPVQQALRPQQAFTVPKVNTAPRPQWVDSDGNLIPSIESELPAGYDNDITYDAQVPQQNNPQRASDGSGVVNTYPQWASEDSILGDSLDRASARLQREINSLQRIGATSRPTADSLDASLAMKSQRIDSLERRLTLLERSPNAADTLTVAEAARLRAELDDLRRRRNDDLDRQRLLSSDATTARQLQLEAELAEIERLRERDRLEMRNQRMGLRDQRRLSNAQLQAEYSDNADVAELAREQRAMREQLQQLSAQLAAMQGYQPGVMPPAVQPVMPAQPLAPTSAVTPSVDPALVAELQALRNELAALRAQLSTQSRSVTTPNAPPTTITVAPAPPTSAGMDRRAEVLEALRSIDVKRVFFEVGQADISTEARNTLNDVATVAQRYPDYIVVRLEGFTDKTGSQELNQRLSERRVRAVRQTLESLGVNSGQIVVQALGEDFDASDLSFGRRVEVRLGVR